MNASGTTIEPPPDGFVDLAGRLADAAGAVALHYFRTPVAVDAKADASPVTIADREAEAAMRAIIEAEVPGHGIYGEEHGRVRLDAEWVWVLDPIDGTKAFVVGRPLFGTLIGLLRNGVPVVGVIDCPALRERWIGALGRVTTFNGRTVKARACPGLEPAWISTTTTDPFSADEAAGFDRLRDAARVTTYGGDCHSYGLVASGSLDIALDVGTQPYDYCALPPVIEGAGGRVSDWRGAPLGLDSDGTILAAGDPALHTSALKLLNS